MKFSITNNALVPFDDLAVKYLNHRPVGEVLHVAALDEGEMKFRSFVFMALNKVAQAADMPLDELRAKLQIESGRFNWIKVRNVTQPVWSVKSMNTLSMGHDDLKDFWEDAKKIIREMLPTLPAEKAEEIETILIS